MKETIGPNKYLREEEIEFLVRNVYLKDWYLYMRDYIPDGPEKWKRVRIWYWLLRNDKHLFESFRNETRSDNQ